MKFLRKKIAPLAAALSAFALPAYAEDAASITEAIKAGKTQLHLRFRYEDVDQRGTEDAAATTLKTRLTYTSGTYDGFGLTLEVDDTTEVGKDDYSTGVANKGTAVIADQEVTEINQSFVSYTKGPTSAKYGRQRINLDNQRFVGGVGWRQDEQTYDAFSLTSKPVTGLAFFYAYITDVNRVFAELYDHNHETHLLNAKYDTSVGSLVGYGYLLEDKAFQVLSSDTFGLRWQGKAGQLISYNLEFAKQQDAADNPVDYSANYLLGEILASLPVGSSKLNFKGGYEVLESDEGRAAFSTPLATLHAFQGWADKFIGSRDLPMTIGTGIKDAYLGTGVTLGAASLGIEYHTYTADEGDLDYGKEWDFIADTKVGPLGLTLKYADYAADDYATDTKKLWLMAAVTF